MPETLRVLVHPDEPDGDFGPYHQIWETWKKYPDIHIIPWPSAPYQIHYLDDQEIQPKFVVVGGQLSYVCVRVHLNELALHPRIKNGEIGLSVSITATFGGHLQEVVTDVYSRTSVQIQIVE